MEFNDRGDGYKAVQKTYGLKFENIKTMEPKLRYQAIEKDDINLIDAYSTDAELKQYDMVVLKDDKKSFPPYQGAPLFKKSFIKDHPQVEKALNQLEGKITDEEMQDMNYRVTEKGESPSKVAKEYLKKKVYFTNNTKRKCLRKMKVLKKMPLSFKNSSASLFSQ